MPGFADALSSGIGSGIGSSIGGTLNPLNWINSARDNKLKKEQLALQKDQWNFEKMLQQYDLDNKKKSDQWKIDFMRAMANGNNPSKNTTYSMDYNVPNTNTDNKIGNIWKQFTQKNIG